MILYHVTLENERWDQIAYRYYGDAFKYEGIIAANPHVPIAEVLPSGLKLAIPLIAKATVTPAEDLPPWLR